MDNSARKVFPNRAAVRVTNLSFQRYLMRHKFFYLSVSEVLFSCRSTMLYNYHISLALYQYMSDELKLLHLPSPPRFQERIPLYYSSVSETESLNAHSQNLFSFHRAWTMSPEQSKYIWRKTIPHIEVGMGSGVFTSHRSARFVLISD